MITKDNHYLNISKEENASERLSSEKQPPLSTKDNFLLNSPGGDNSKAKAFFLPEEVRKSHKNLSPREVILTLLRAKNWKKVDLAREIGYSKQALHNYLNGIWAIPTQVKIKIAQAFSVDSAVIWDLEETR